LAEREPFLRWLSSAEFHFRHIGWHPLAFWIGRPVSLCLRAPDGKPAAAILASPDRLGVVWLHLFAASTPPGHRAAWLDLWNETKNQLAEISLTAVWAMTTQAWLIELLLESGFSGHGRVIAFSRNTHGAIPGETDNAPIVPMTEADLQPVERLDHLAFGTPWQMDSDALKATLERSLLAVVLRMENRIAGYLMASAAPQGMHITRIAVDPELQRRGIGRALLIHLLNYGRRRGAPRITVNTQHDNPRSRQLYRSMGFSEIGESYPVFRWDWKKL
jgi:ribosomal-protein-alanine N-acetyltransferase